MNNQMGNKSWGRKTYFFTEAVPRNTIKHIKWKHSIKLWWDFLLILLD